MATLDEVRQEVDKDELDYPELALALGPDALPHLKALVAEDVPRIASKAAYLASLIEGGAAQEVIALAAASRHDVVRVAAAAAAASLPADKGVEITLRLLEDADEGVRIRALKSAATIGDPAFSARLRGMAAGDPAPHIRSLSADVAAGLRH
jgi:HEAT repeats